ncbi:hypothetical protein ACIHCQ_32640 [Streptomyces sp. NPDC052236]|uniref:hypothetical protein n=1 Tax=Streptomyces sp. NPDC052236 TaxID=3365686 RepID=UPI0037CD4CD4
MTIRNRRIGASISYAVGRDQLGIEGLGAIRFWWRRRIGRPAEMRLALGGGPALKSGDSP